MEAGKRQDVGETSEGEREREAGREGERERERERVTGKA